MGNKLLPGYAGQYLWADLTSRKLSRVPIDEAFARKYIGGTGIGIELLYNEVAPEVEWNGPQNRLIFATGPLNGTRIMGSGTISIITKGAMTNGATSSQASGFMGAFMKLSGFDAVIIQGASDQWIYLYLHDGIAEIRNAGHLSGETTHNTEKIIKRELGHHRKDMSVFSIGPGGENQVPFAAIVGDGGHVAAHNGIGAVMGSKKLKAIVASRGSTQGIEIHDTEKVDSIGKEIFSSIKSNPRARIIYDWGTSMLIETYGKAGFLPVKNYTTSEAPKEINKLTGAYYRKRFNAKAERCWACRMHHVHNLEVTEGPYAGYKGEEPEYEQWAGLGPQLGIADPGAIVVLSNEIDQLGLDANETSWVLGLAIECFLKGIINKKMTDGIELSWGNVEAIRAIIRKIAYREGIGEILSGGVKNAVMEIGGQAQDIGIYTLKGSAIRAHDDRGNWQWMLDNCTSNTGVSETMGAGAALEPSSNVLEFNTTSPTEVPKMIATRKGIVQFEDSLVLCLFAAGPFFEPLPRLVEAVTGWDFNTEEALDTGLRIVNLLKAFNIKHGLTAASDAPSSRYGSSQTDGPLRQDTIMNSWEQIRSNYYTEMGWHPETGVPLPETLQRVGLGYLIEDLWGNSQPSR